MPDNIFNYLVTASILYGLYLKFVRVPQRPWLGSLGCGLGTILIANGFNSLIVHVLNIGTYETATLIGFVVAILFYNWLTKLYDIAEQKRNSTEAEKSEV